MNINTFPGINDSINILNTINNINTTVAGLNDRVNLLENKCNENFSINNYKIEEHRKWINSINEDINFLKLEVQKLNLETNNFYRQYNKEISEIKSNLSENDNRFKFTTSKIVEIITIISTAIGIIIALIKSKMIDTLIP